MNWLKSGIKRRVFALLTGLALGLFISYSALSILVAYVVEDHIINQMIRVEAQLVQKRFAKTGGWSTSNEYFQIYESLNQMPQEYREQIQRPNPEREIFSETGRHFHFLKLMLGNQQVYLIGEVTQLLVVSNMSGAIIVMTSLGLVVAFFLTLYVTYRISAKTVKPVTDLTEAVRNLSSKSSRLPPELIQSPDEIGFLAQNLQQSFEQLTTAIERESEFTRDVSHELRTPVTVMTNMLQLNAGKPMTQGQQASMLQQLETLNSQISALLALARAESVEKQSMKLITVVEEAVLSLHDLIQSKKFEIDINIPYSLDVLVDPHLVRLLINNLIENAIKHASQPKLTISFNDGELSFTNPSSAKADDSIMLKAHKGSKSDGLGQGLFLVSRILEKTGWGFSLDCSETHFTLVIKLARLNDSH